MAAASAMKDYLQRYVGGAESSGVDFEKAQSKKKKKKKRQGAASALGGVVVVDDDAAWQRESRPEDEEEDEGDEEGPTVIEDVEVKRMQRMEATKTHRPYLSMADDGSGWVTVSEDGSRRRAPASEVFAAAPVRSTEAAHSGASPDLSPPRRGAPEDSSPPRRSKAFTGAEGRAPADLSPPRRAAFLESSSPRRSKAFMGDARASLDLSPPRRAAFRDSSPPRRSKAPSGASARGSRDSTPARTKPSDASFPKRRHDSPSASPPARHRSGNFSSAGEDLFSGGPSGRNRGQHSSPLRHTRDLSPPRRRHASPDAARTASAVAEDFSSLRRSKFSMQGRKASLDDSRTWNGRNSPRRRRHDSTEMDATGDGGSERLSPRRRSEALDRTESHDYPRSPRRRASTDVVAGRSVDRRRRRPNVNEYRDGSPVLQRNVSAKMMDGVSAGLKFSREGASEAERRRAAEEKALSELDPTLSGRGATTVFRDKRGRRLEGADAILRQQKGAEKPPDEPLEWGKGLAQKKLADANLAELEKEKSKPFARYRDDAELDQSLRERVRFGDPMAHLVKKKVALPILEDLGDSEKMKASGFIVPQDIPKHSWLRGSQAPPPNRYDIRPGRHWDGVDRSTGYEQNLFKQNNEKRARDLEAYLWSVSDM